MAAAARSGWVLVFCLSLCGLVAWCEQCKPDLYTPCKADCNGTSFDLSAAFNFPVEIEDVNFPYTWSPCDGFKCMSGSFGHTDCAVCQKPYNISCGKMSNPVWIWEVREPTHGDDAFPNWHIEYTFGETWRMSIFHFILDETQVEPVVKFMGEVPHLQYNFHVIGKCLGQLTPECNKIYEERRRLAHQPFW